MASPRNKIVKFPQPKTVVNLAYPIALLQTQIKGLSEKKKYCESHDHSKASAEEQGIVKIFLESVDDNIFALKKAIKKLES